MVTGAAYPPCAPPQQLRRPDYHDAKATGMSASPPITDLGGVQTMSALCQQRTSSPFIRGRITFESPRQPLPPGRPGRQCRQTFQSLQ